MLERGPSGRLHVPSWRTDCWRGRPAGMCWCCWVRLLTLPLQHREGGRS